ncbi:hypothetical protein KHV-MN_00101 [Cyprinid herpesvirus 3]|nr:hypothetical protein KHV-MN_00101 [Cyprinid herpesvirus 3]
MSNLETFLECFSGYFAESVLSGAHMDWVRAMDDHVARRIASLQLDQIQSKVREQQEWEETQTELTALDEEAKRLASEIERIKIELKASGVDENIRKLRTVRLHNLQSRFDNIYEMVATQAVSNTQYITAKQQAEVLNHLAKQPRVRIDPTKAMAAQRHTRRVFELSKQSMTVISRLNQKTAGIPSDDVSVLLGDDDVPPSPSSHKHHHHHSIPMLG